MMNIMILLILTLILYGLLFRNFGVMSEEDRKKQEEMLENFLNDMNRNATAGDGNDGKTTKPKVIVIGGGRIFNRARQNKYKKNGSKTPADMEKLGELNEKYLLKTAEKLMVHITEAFSGKKLDLLEKMLTRELFTLFKGKIEAMGDSSYHSVIISFKTLTIGSREVRNSEEHVTFKASMEQINYVEDGEGNVLRGSRDKISEIDESWTFKLNRVADSSAIDWLLETVRNVQEERA